MPAEEGSGVSETSVAAAIDWSSIIQSSVQRAEATAVKKAAARASNQVRNESLLIDKDSLATEDIASRHVIGSGLGTVDVVVAHFAIFGRKDDRQRSRLRYVNRHLPPYFMSVAYHGRRRVPRRWR